jgi:hypothetical protein
MQSLVPVHPIASTGTKLTGSAFEDAPAFQGCPTVAIRTNALIDVKMRAPRFGSKDFLNAQG